MSTLHNTNGEWNLVNLTSDIRTQHFAEEPHKIQNSLKNIFMIRI